MAKNTNKRSAYLGGTLCKAHGLAEGLASSEFTLVPHHSEQADDDEIACDACTVAIMRKAGAL